MYKHLQPHTYHNFKQYIKETTVVVKLATLSKVPMYPHNYNLHVVVRYNWRAGASQPSRTTGTIFLYIYIIFGRTGTADIRCLRTHYIHVVYIYVT